MKKYLFIFLAILSGCTNISSLKKPENPLEFTLAEDSLIFYSGGMVETRHCRGLLKGSYKQIAEDDEGYYFVEASGKVIRLIGSFAEEFERTKIYPKIKDPNITGLWVPKPSSKKPVDMFLLTGVGDLDDHYKGAGGGVITYGVSNLIEGSVLFWHEPRLPDMSEVISAVRHQ